MNAHEEVIKIIEAKRRIKVSSFDLNLTPDEIIENELKTGTKFCSLKRSDLLKKTLKLIEGNKFEELKENEPVFIQTFGKKYAYYAKNELKNYLFVFVLLFGSHELADLFNPKNQFHDDIIEILPEILRYLFNTKPLNASMTTVLKLCSSKIGKDLKIELIKIVNIRFPDLDYFERIILNFIGASDSEAIGNYFNEPDKNKKMRMFFSFARCCDPKYLIHFQRFPLEKPDIFQGSELEEITKTDVLVSVFRNDNIEILPEILDVYSDIILYNLNYSETQCFNAFNVFESTIRHRAYKCFEFFLELIPEMLETNLSHNVCPIKLAILSAHGDDKFLKILDSKGVKYNRILPKDQLNDKSNLLQFSFMCSRATAFMYYYRQAGVEIAKKHLYEIYETDNDLIKFCFSHFDDNITKIIVDDFGIDLNEKKFRSSRKVGNASVHFGRWALEARAAYFNIKIYDN